MGRARRDFLRAGALALLLTGCYTSQPIQTVPLVLLAPDNPNRPEEILVKTEAGGKETLRSPWLSGDTLVGTSLSGRDSIERRIPLDSVLVIETQRFSAGTSAGGLLLVVLVTTATLLTVVMVSMY